MGVEHQPDRVSYILGGAGFQPSTVVFQPSIFRGKLAVSFREGIRFGCFNVDWAGPSYSQIRRFVGLVVTSMKPQRYQIFKSSGS